MLLCVSSGETTPALTLRYLVGFAAFQGPEFLYTISSSPIWNRGKKESSDWDAQLVCLGVFGIRCACVLSLAVSYSSYVFY